MNETMIALGISIVIIFILLVTCWSGKKHQSRRRPRVRVLDDIKDDSHQRSKWGSGARNTQLSKQYNDLNRLSSYDDYNSVIQYQSLEPEVFDSHNSFAHDIGVANSGASALAVTSHDNYPVYFVGLRRPDLHSVFAGADARVQHSEFADQMPSQTTYCV
jgi:nitrogen fixation-related uncharacterized protein